MAEFQLTREQDEAVRLDANIAVTAGAGTGKTSAMTQRIARVVTELDHIHQLLVVTFTDEAASEIRQRVYRAIVWAISRSEGERLQRIERIRDQFFDNHISTMHTFFARLLRRFPDAIEGMDPDFTILEGAEQEDLLRGSVGHVLDAAARDREAPLRPDLRAWLRQRQRRARVRAAIEALIRKRVELRPWLRKITTGDPAERLAAHREFAAKFIVEAQRGFFGSRRVLETIRLVESLSVASLDDSDKMYEPLKTTLDAFEEQDAAALRATMITKNGASRRFGRTGRHTAWDGDALDELRGAMNDLAELVGSDDSLTLVWDGAIEAATFDALRSLAQLTVACLDEYAERKRRVHALDFVDLEERAADLLQNDAIVRTLRRQFRAIFIDEFQDTNRHQWELFRKLSLREGSDTLEPAKLFIVGDEKQAIYSFRGGEVEVFARARGEIEAPLGFTANFRSNENLLLFFNRFFERLLTGGEAFEASAQALRLKDAPSVPEDSVDVSEGGSVRQLVFEDSDGSDNEREAFAVAELLRGIADGERETEYPGIAARMRRSEPTVGILFRRTTHQRAYEDALRAFGVQYVAAKGKGYFERQEIRDLRNLLRVAHDARNDIALAGVLRSPLVGCSDVALLLLRRMRRFPFESLWPVLMRSDEGDFPAADALAFSKARTLLTRWRRAARARGIAETVALALEESGAYAPLSVGSDGLQRRLNVEKFVEIARAFESSGAPTLGDFIRYLDTQDESRDDEGDADLPEGGSVQLLTVHRAKGLEWPLVIVPDTGARFRDDIDETSNVGVAVSRPPSEDGDADFEAAMKHWTDEHGYVEPFMWRAFKRERNRRERAEQKRLLYVAFTRAKEHLVFCAHRETDKKPPEIDAARTWSDWIDAIVADGDVTRGSTPFFFEEPIGETDRERLTRTVESSDAVAFDPSRLWAAPTPTGRTFRLTDEPAGGRTTIPGHPDLPHLAKVSSVEAALSGLGNRLLEVALSGEGRREALLARAKAWRRFERSALSDTAIERLADDAARIADWLRETFAGAEFVTNQPFEHEVNGQRLVGQIDALAFGADRPLASVDVKYARSVDSVEQTDFEPQARLIGGATKAVLGVDSLRHVVLLAGRDDVAAYAFDL